MKVASAPTTLVWSASRACPRGPQARAQSTRSAGAVCRRPKARRFPVSGPRREPLAPFRDLLADRRRPLRARARDRVRHPRSIRQYLLAELQQDPAVSRQRRDSRVADDDVLRRALLHAAAPDRHPGHVERTPRRVVRLGVEPDVPARNHRAADRATARAASTASSSGRSTSPCSSSGSRTSSTSSPPSRSGRSVRSTSPSGSS